MYDCTAELEKLILGSSDYVAHLQQSGNKTDFPHLCPVYLHQWFLLKNEKKKHKVLQLTELLQMYFLL